MDLNSSITSTDTDTLIKIPHNLFEVDLDNSKSHFSNDHSFMREIDNFLHANDRKDALNSTNQELPSYAKFADTLQQSSSNPNEQDADLNMQLVNIFQKKIQNCQERIAKLTKANLEKGEIIRKLKENEGLDVENEKLKQKIKLLEEETAEMINLITKFQAKNEVLESKIEGLTLNSREMSDIAKKQIQELETRLSNCLKIENELQSEIENLTQKCKEETENAVKEKNARSQLDTLVNSLKTQIKQAKEEKTKMQERFEEEKRASESKQKKIFNNIMSETAEKERKLVKELDVQRVAMKNYYQAQLESAISSKVAEFQEQLDQYQQELRAESEERERQCNERLLGQMEMIVRKNEEEIDLIKQKCAEEVDLYRIQLVNATKTIESLEHKLSEYQAKRQNVADRLHFIMESQWKKILDVLACPSRPVSRMDLNEISETENSKQQQQCLQCEPTMNNLSRSEENLKSELLHNYIEKLLNAPPKSVGEGRVSDDEKMMNRKSRNAKNAPWK